MTAGVLGGAGGGCIGVVYSGGRRVVGQWWRGRSVIIVTTAMVKCTKHGRIMVICMYGIKTRLRRTHI